MKVVDINGTRHANTVEELEAILNRRCENSMNSFWLTHGEHEFPALSLLVRENLATLTYLPREFDPGFRSIGGYTTSEETTRLPISANPGDDVVVRSDSMIPFSAALIAAKEFFVSSSIPKSIDWLQL